MIYGLKRPWSRLDRCGFAILGFDLAGLSSSIWRHAPVEAYGWASMSTCIAIILLMSAVAGRSKKS